MDTRMFDKMRSAPGFAALDQSGGSTTKALRLYSVGDDQYSDEAQMFDRIHEMRTRIITDPAFTGTGSWAPSCSNRRWTVTSTVGGLRTTCGT